MKSHSHIKVDEFIMHPLQLLNTIVLPRFSKNQPMNLLRTSTVKLPFNPKKWMIFTWYPDSARTGGCIVRELVVCLKTDEWTGLAKRRIRIVVGRATKNCKEGWCIHGYVETFSLVAVSLAEEIGISVGRFSQFQISATGWTTTTWANIMFQNATICNRNSNELQQIITSVYCTYSSDPGKLNSVKFNFKYFSVPWNS